MNKNRHRVVFNAARGLRVVVAECARALGKASTTTAILATALLAAALLPAQAQISADPKAPGSQRPTILTAPNGIPLVNIQTPSPAGVSRNTYRQFDVNAPGAILNNSRTNVQTQLGGWVPGNPWLATGGARVILNEVNSTNPSYLKGPIEVAGQGAEVIIANPAGIQVNGGSFLNATGVTLTTGKPVMKGGSLESFLVRGGQVRIEGLGLDTRGANFAAILARAIEVNAAIWANKLTIVGGAAETQASGTDASGAPITKPIAPDPNAPKPRVMLDVAAIGGMYAGKIFLVGSENGLGVNNKGIMSAITGELTLLPNGMLINSGMLNGQSIDIQAQSVNNAGTLQAGHALSVLTHGQLTNSGTVNGQTIDLKAEGVDNAGVISAQQTLNVLLDGKLVNHGAMYANALKIQGPQVLNEGSAVIAARESLTINAEQIHNTEGAELLSLGKMELNATERIENRSARIEAMGTLAIQTPVLINANDHFKTELIAQPGQRYLRVRHAGVDYRAEDLGLNFDRLDQYDDQAYWRVLLPSADYPFAAFPAMAEQWAVRSSLGEAFEVELSRNCDDLECSSGMRETYALDHPIWQRLGVASPGPAPAPPQTGPECVANPDACQSPQWEPYQAHKTAQLDALDKKITAYNDSVKARTLTDWVVIDATSTAYDPRVLSSAPAQIVSGGDMALKVSSQLLNDNSEILAGGALKVEGVKIANRGTDVIARTEVTGQAVHSVYDGDDVFSNPDRLYSFSPYKAVQERGQAVNVARSAGGQAIPAMAPPSALFKVAPDPQSTVLIATDPLFANGRQWLGSDHLISALALDFGQLQKRLGDGFYEQRLIREQVGQLTGQRFLGDYRDDEAQFLALMNAGLTFAHKVQLRPGIALSAEQMAALTSDIVWLVTEEVTLPDGRKEKALVPRVYLAPRSGDLSPSGALIAGNTVNIHMSGDVLNSGTVAGRELVQVNAGRDIEHSGTITTQGTAVLSAGRDTAIQGGEIRAVDAIVLDAGRDLTIASTTRSTTTPTNGSGTSSFERTGVDRQARLSDVQNNAKYEASSVSVSGGVGSQLGNSGAGVGSDKGSNSSTTVAAISGIAGNKAARTGDTETSLAPIFDKQRTRDEVEAQVKITAAFGKAASTAWGTYANEKFSDAVAAEDEDAAHCWAPDGACRAGGHALIGGIGGGVGGALGAATSSLTASTFMSVLSDLGVPEGIAQGLTDAYAAGMGAIAGGAAGAAGALNEASNNATMAARLILGTIELGGASLARKCLASPECVGVVGGIALQSIIEASSHSGNAPSIGDVNPNVFGGTEAGLPADTYGTPPGGPQDEDETKPTRITNEKHHKNSKSPEPNNVDDLYQNSVPDRSGVRWTKDADGVVHRFSKPSNGETHWNGSTAGTNPIKMENIPIEIRRILGVK